MIRGPKKAISVSLPLELYTTLKTLSQEDNRTLSGYIRQILKRYVRHYEQHKDDPEDTWIIGV